MARLEEPDVQGLNEIASYHQDTVKALTRYFTDWESIDSVRYLGMTYSEISEVFQRRLSETESRSILQVLTSVEAALRIDYRSRYEGQAKDPLSLSLRGLHQQRGHRPRLDHILDLWGSHHPELKKIVEQLRNALHLRHWLAHGRYWRPANWVRYSYEEIEGLAAAFFEGFPLSS